MYQKLGIAVGINTVVMFVLTYALIDSADHFYANINRMYMAVLMALPMVIVMLIVMRKMYPDAKMNGILHVAAGVAFVAVLWLMRSQTPVGNSQFLRSMIPHHSSAIVMCEEAAITDPDIRTLCDAIVKTQKEEIAEMKRLLARY